VNGANDIGHGLRGSAIDVGRGAMRGQHLAISIDDRCLDLGAAEIHSDGKLASWWRHRFFRFQGVSRLAGYELSK
jgi:hypothetical protein